eukprot:3875753-Rhodomonas_salina.1
MGGGRRAFAEPFRRSEDDTAEVDEVEVGSILRQFQPRQGHARCWVMMLAVVRRGMVVCWVLAGADGGWGGEQREDARKDRDYRTADDLRDTLQQEFGVTVDDDERE